MNKVTIVITNQSFVVAEADLDKWLPALQTQISRDFAPIWGVDATLYRPTRVPANLLAQAYHVILKDDADDASDLGFHLQGDDNLPEARIFCKPTLADGDTISSVLSHELLEMLADPSCTRMSGAYIVEVCDPVESTGYLIDNIDVSNFVYPRYFSIFEGPQDKFDYNGQLTTGCPTRQAGGYIMWWDGGKWDSAFGRRKEDGKIPYQALKAGRALFRASRGAPGAIPT